MSTVKIRNNTTLAANVAVLGNLAVSGTLSPTNLDADSASATTLAIGNDTDNVIITASGITLAGDATMWEDLRIDGMMTRVGTTAPSDETGFRGSGSMQMRTFVHTQPDEVSFIVQLPHAYKVGSTLYPHVHFSPVVGGSNGNQASFIFDYYASAINEQYPATSASVRMTASWTGDKQWYHLIADTPTGISGSGLGISSLLHGRVYRDNSGACNLQGKVAFEYFDIHYEVDSLGSKQEYIK